MQRAKKGVVKCEFPPVFDENSKILILGTMPSVKSRENGFYFSNPQNRFWKVISTILNEKFPENNDEKKELLLRNNIALWDTLDTCEIVGSADSTIKDPVPNDINYVVENSSVKAIFTTGAKAYQMYNKFSRDKTGIEAVKLASTSPANCRNYTLEKLTEEYRVILEYL